MVPTGNETLPNSLYYAGTGFVRGKVLHNATSSEVYSSIFKVRNCCTVWLILSYYQHYKYCACIFLNFAIEFNVYLSLKLACRIRFIYLYLYDWQVKAACIGARISSAPPVDILPRHKPYLHKIQPKDPVELENGGYVRKLSV